MANNLAKISASGEQSSGKICIDPQRIYSRPLVDSRFCKTGRRFTEPVRLPDNEVSQGIKNAGNQYFQRVLNSPKRKNLRLYANLTPNDAQIDAKGILRQA